MNATCSICGWNGFQGGWTSLRCPRGRILALFCFHCGLLWESIKHQIDCDGCYQCMKGGQFNNEAILDTRGEFPRPDQPTQADRPFYPTLAAFYDDEPTRWRSEEADYGVHWRLPGWEHKWRVSYVRDTGEIYAVYQCLTVHDEAQRALSYGPVFVLGHVEPDPVPEGDRRSLFHRTLEDILDGWAQRCGTPDGMFWVRDRLDAADCTAH